MNDYNFGNLLYELRTEKGLSQSELGEMFGVSNKAVSKWEMGISKPRPAMLIDLASFFSVSVEELMLGKRLEKQSEHPINAEIKIRVEEYHREKRKKFIAFAVMLMIFAIYLILGVVIIISGKEDTVLGPVLTLVAIFAEFAASILFLSFHTAQKRQQRTLYSSFPEKTEDIKDLLTSKSRIRKAEIPKKWKYFSLFFSILVLSISIGNVIFQITHNFFWTFTALVISVLVLGSISALILKLVKRHSPRKDI